MTQAFKCDACREYYEEEVKDQEYRVVAQPNRNLLDLCKNCNDKVQSLFRYSALRKKPERSEKYKWSREKKENMQKLRHDARILSKKENIPYHKAMNFASRRMKGENVDKEIKQVKKELSAATISSSNISFPNSKISKPSKISLPGTKISGTKRTKEFKCPMCFEKAVAQTGDMCEDCERKFGN